MRAVGVPPPPHPPAGWARQWAAADLTASSALDQALDKRDAPVGPRLAAELIAALPNGALITIGSSNPIRDVALAARPRGGLTVVANRGVAGIDGTVSTAFGAAPVRY